MFFFFFFFARRFEFHGRVTFKFTTVCSVSFRIRKEKKRSIQKSAAVANVGRISLACVSMPRLQLQRSRIIERLARAKCINRTNGRAAVLKAENEKHLFPYFSSELVSNSRRVSELIAPFSLTPRSVFGRNTWLNVSHSSKSFPIAKARLPPATAYRRIYGRDVYQRIEFVPFSCFGNPSTQGYDIHL